MRVAFFFCSVLVLLGIFGRSANAQWAVTDPAAEASLVTTNTELGTANTTLGRIAVSTQATATTTADTLTMMNTPTIIMGAFTALNGGADANATTETTEFVPILGGTTSTSLSAGELEKQEEANLKLDEAKALLTGNSADAQEQRHQRIGTNLQGQAYADLKVYGSRFAALDALEAKLSQAKDIKQAITWNGGVEIQSVKSLNLLGQSISLNTAAVIEARLEVLNEAMRVQDGYRETALKLAVP